MSEITPKARMEAMQNVLTAIEGLPPDIGISVLEQVKFTIQITAWKSIERNL